jgi:predicted Zn-dependent peptidase
MKNKILTLALVTSACALTVVGCKSSTIASRPEQLKYPALSFQPPLAEQYRVQLKSGPVAYVVPDRELPLVNISIQVRVGDYLTPKGKEGLAGLVGIMLAHGGTANMTAPELEERLAFLAAQLRSSVGDNSGMVSLNILSKDLDEGMTLLRDVVATPRFQDNKVELRKQQLMQEMRQRNDDSQSIEAQMMHRLAFGEKFWMNQDDTAKSVEGITHEDLVQFHQRWFHPGNFIVAVSGDFDRADMIARLEKLFANWPFKGETPPPIPTNTEFAPAGVYVVNKEVNQGRVSMMLPGIMRDDPDYFAATLMNEILGGGGFTSRIMNRVRTEEGLAYSAGSMLPGGVYFAPPFVAEFQTKSRTVPYAVSLVIDEMKKMVAAPVTDEELNVTVSGIIERFPRTFASKGQVAIALANEEFTGRYAKDPNYFKTYREKVRAVTKADIQRVAKRLLDANRLDILIVGDEKEILLGHPDHPQHLHDFLGGKVTQLPLLDPMTLEPLGPVQPIPAPAAK